MLQLQRLSKSFGTTPVFHDVGLEVARGEFVALIGESGVGKSTLLNCIAGLERPDSGTLHLDGQDVLALDDDARARLRRGKLGFVFQAFHVLPHLSVAENVSLPLLLLGRPDAQRVRAVLDAVGLGELGARLPSQLSGGQLQRVAIARAVVHAPALILADEPTGNLDPATAQRVLSVLVAQVRQAGAACLLVTHSEAAAMRADRVLRLGAGGVQPLHAAPLAPTAHSAPPAPSGSSAPAAPAVGSNTGTGTGTGSDAGAGAGTGAHAAAGTLAGTA